VTESGSDGAAGEAVDPFLDLLERYLLGGPRTYNRLQVAERAGLDPARTEVLWRALGFTRAEDSEVVFGEADVDAARLMNELAELGVLSPEREATVARTVGRTFARLAEWQDDLLVEQLGAESLSPEELRDLAAVLVPKIEELQNYTWRRALLASLGRRIVHPHGEEGTLQVVGFADIVGYTSQSRRLSEDELERLVEHFEGISNDIVTEHRGRIIKTIGDEILFVADEPRDAGLIALALVEQRDADELFPLVRVGLAYGPVLARLGDVFGSVVNLASRLTTVAKPGRVLVDRELHRALEHDPAFALRRTRRTSVKGYERLEPFRLKRPHDAS
jgi:adenylate cyclase